MDHAVAGPDPGDPPRLGAGLGQAREGQAVPGEVAQDRAGVAEGGEPLEHGGHREPHRLVGILHHRPVGAAAVADRERHRQLAAPGLAQQRAPHARLQDVQFRREQRPLDAQQEPVVGALGVVDAVLVGDERAEHRAELDDAVPVAVQARQPGDLGHHDDADLAQADRRDQALEAETPLAAGSRQAEVVVDHPDRRLRPAHLPGAARQVILAAGALLVVLDLLRRGLADVDDGLQPQVARLDLGRARGHGSPPCSSPGGRPAGGAGVPPTAPPPRRERRRAGASRSGMPRPPWSVSADGGMPCSRTNRTKARRLLGENNKAGMVGPSGAVSVQDSGTRSDRPSGSLTTRMTAPSRVILRTTRTTCPRSAWPRWLIRTQSACLP
jgi:hypothetical protein